MSFHPLKPREYGTTKDVVSRLIADFPTPKLAAHAVDRSLTTIYAWTDPDEPDQITFDQLRRLVEASGSSAPAEDLAALARGFFTPIEASEASLAALLARGEREHGNAMASIIDRLGRHADGELEGAERATLRREIDAMIRAFVAAARKLEDEA